MFAFLPNLQDSGLPSVATPTMALVPWKDTLQRLELCHMILASVRYYSRGITYDFFRTFDLSCSGEGWYKQEEQDL
jgi:hypothetical protein